MAEQICEKTAEAEWKKGCMYSPFVNTGSKINGQIAGGGEHPDGESAENRQRREGGKQEAFSKQCHIEFSF